MFCFFAEKTPLSRRAFESAADRKPSKVALAGGPDLVIPDDGRSAVVSMLRGQLKAPAAGMVVFLLKKIERVEREDRDMGEIERERGGGQQGCHGADVEGLDGRAGAARGGGGARRQRSGAC